MDIGKGYIVSDEWIPKGIKTGLKDIKGNEIKTSDIVKLNGCTSIYAVVGYNMYNSFVIFFGGDNGSVQCNLTNETIQIHSVEVLK